MKIQHTILVWTCIIFSSFAKAEVENSDVFVAGYLHGNPTWEVLELSKAVEIEVYYLDSDSRFSSDGKRIHGWKVTGHRRIEDKAVIESVAKAMQESVRQECKNHFKVTGDNRIVVTSTTVSSDAPSLAIRFIWRNSGLERDLEITLMIESYTMRSIFEWEVDQARMARRLKGISTWKPRRAKHSQIGSSWYITRTLCEQIEGLIEPVAGGDATR